MQRTCRALPVRQALCWSQRSFHQRTEKARSEEEGQVTAWKWAHTSDRVLSVRGGDTRVGNSSFRAGAELTVGNVLSPRLSWQQGCVSTAVLGNSGLGLPWPGSTRGSFPEHRGKGKPSLCSPLIAHTVAECSDHS